MKKTLNLFSMFMLVLTLLISTGLTTDSSAQDTPPTVAAMMNAVDVGSDVAAFETVVGINILNVVAPQYMSERFIIFAPRIESRAQWNRHDILRTYEAPLKSKLQFYARKI